MDRRAIGVFDSGLGGLTVVKEIKKVLPKEKIEYLGDTARVPYGTRSKEIIIKFAEEDINYLLTKNVKCIVIACNSVSSVASKVLKKNYKLPIFDILSPVCKYVAKDLKIKKVGIIGTPATIKSDSYKRLIQKLNKEIRVFQNKAPLLVPFVEEGEIDSEITFKIVYRYVKPLLDKKVDALILGCTHYPILLPVFRKILKNRVKIIDPAKFLGKALKIYLEDNNLLNDDIIHPVDKFSVTDITEGFKKQFRIFFGNYKNKLVKISLTNNEK